MQVNKKKVIWDSQAILRFKPTIKETIRILSVFDLIRILKAYIVQQTNIVLQTKKQAVLMRMSKIAVTIL